MKIIEELKNYLAPLSQPEYRILKHDILKNGCIEPLVVWGETLVDGHNRYEICTAEDIEFKTKQIDFDDIDDAIKWVVDKQLGRRNLNPEVFKLLLGRKYEWMKKPEGGDGTNQFTIGTKEELRQNDAVPRTSMQIADEHNVSSRTVERAGDAAKAIDSAIPEVAQSVMKGDLKLNDAAAIATLEEAEQVEVMAKKPAEIKQVAKALTTELPSLLKCTACNTELGDDSYRVSRIDRYGRGSGESDVYCSGTCVAGEWL